ncbi:GrpB family protein [Pedobacter sp. KR3-3]|uniref:GrpB family protein n=1 Tax=Pedobacter albus TaxID=3113905 RepID=A0ABU7I8Y8_9SPHI|nr:GrpB family protein [Pedobacter sp. KR3-3]MEE1945942.1 GrpB family protein [Pedobacter sp. KR3-3]
MPKFIEPYNPAWKAEFERIHSIIKAKLNDLDITIQHVGSTSIPGLVAKPILDIDIVLTDKGLLGNVAQRLEGLGYKSMGEQGIVGRFAFKQLSEYVPLTNPKCTWQSHHLYVCYSDSLALKNHLLFREALLNDKNLLESYSQLKETLTDNSQITKEKYWKQKTAFIVSVLEKMGLTAAELEEITKTNS